MTKRNKIEQLKALLAGIAPDEPFTITVIDHEGRDIHTGELVDLADDKTNKITGFIIQVKKSGKSR